MVNSDNNKRHEGNKFRRSLFKIYEAIQFILSRGERQLKLRIKSKLGVAFVGFASIPMIVVGTILWYFNIQSMRSNAITELSHISEVITIRLKDFSNVLQTDLELINANFGAIISQNERLNSPGNPIDLFQEQLEILMEAKPHYYRLTFLVDSLKSQLFSYQRDLNNKDHIVQSESNYSWYYYRLLVNNLPPNQMRIIPVEHLDKRSNITLAAFSVALPYRNDQEELIGIFITDIFADYFFNLIETSLSDEKHYIAGIIDQDGYYLYHSQKKNEWNRLLAETSIHALEKEFSPEFAKQIINPDKGILETDKGEVVFHVPLEMGALGLQKKYYFYLLEPGTQIFYHLRQFGLIFLIAMAGFIIIAMYLSRIATIQFVEPIQQLKRGSDRISRGNFSHRLEIATGDEIQEMAEHFNFMAQSIEERDKQLHEINASLEEIIDERTVELQDEKDKLRIILDNVPNAFILIDSHKVVVTASSALKQFTGFSPQEAVGKKCFEIMNTIADCGHCRGNGFNKNRTIFREEIQKVNQNGEEVIYERVNIPVKLVSGEEACLEIFSDITNRIRLQNQLLQSEKLASIGEMASVIAHEIRNSLTSANMLLQLIHEAKVLKGSEYESMEVALTSIERINKVTEDLLAFARPAEIHKEPTDLLTVIHESISMYKRHFELNGIRLDVHSQSDLPMIQIDHKLMQEVFNNILLNASQAIEQNGSIIASIDITPLKAEIRNKFASLNSEFDNKQRKATQQQHNVFRISFQDDGPGCTSENLNKIFDPFYTTKITGTGLGLSLAKRVVEAHGGHIYAVSKPNKGMKINILLPIEVSS